jgi:plastocyanin
VTAIAGPSPVVSTTPTAVPLAQPSVSPATAAGPAVKIVEPPFRQPQEWTYAPAEVSVKVGITVVWTNTGAVAHTVTADDGQAFDSGTIDPKSTFTNTPKAAGTFAYHCTFHPWMKATLVVSS